MITRHHLVLALLATLILGIAIFPEDVISLGMLVLGACIGAVLPDIHMSKPKRMGFRTVCWDTTRFTACICIPVLCIACFYLFGANLCPSDKRLTHSIPGFLVVGAVVAAVPMIAQQFITVPPPLLAFVSGILCGFFLHLLEDLCTKKGITPLYPFRTIRVAGSIRPCDQSDSRIRHYLVHHGCMAFAVVSLDGTVHYSRFVSLEVSLAALFLCLALMVFFSDVHIEPDITAREYRHTTPVLALTRW